MVMLCGCFGSYRNVKMVVVKAKYGVKIVTFNLAGKVVQVC